MIVRITRNQQMHLGALGTERHQWWLDRGIVDGLMVDCMMPPIGWKTLAEEIPNHAFGPRGGRLKGTASILGSALRRISKEQAQLEAHPAFKGMALPGRHFEQFLAWGPSPYPDPYAEVTVLRPEVSESGGIVMTQWHRLWALDLPTGDLMDPNVHWDFMPQPAVPAAVPSA